MLSVALFLSLLQRGPEPTITLNAVGDIMLGRHIQVRLLDLKPADAFYGVRPELFNADLVVGNLECSLTARPVSVRKPITLAASPKMVGQVRGFTAVSLANNHSGDCGPAGIADASKTLESAGVQPVCFEPVELKNQGLKVYAVGICDLPGYRNANWEVAVRRAVELAGEDGLVVALVHWGIEGSPKPSSEQRALAWRLYQMGVKLIIGSHPHVLQPVERLGKDGLVAYSLGNFVFDVPFLRSYHAQRVSQILHVTLNRHGVVGYSCLPVWLKHGFPVLAQK